MGTIGLIVLLVSILAGLFILRNGPNPIKIAHAFGWVSGCIVAWCLIIPNWVYVGPAGTFENHVNWMVTQTGFIDTLMQLPVWNRTIPLATSVNVTQLISLLDTSETHDLLQRMRTGNGLSGWELSNLLMQHYALIGILLKSSVILSVIGIVLHLVSLISNVQVPKSLMLTLGFLYLGGAMVILFNLPYLKDLLETNNFRIRLILAMTETYIGAAPRLTWLGLIVLSVSCFASGRLITPSPSKDEDGSLGVTYEQ